MEFLSFEELLRSNVDREAIGSIYLQLISYAAKYPYAVQNIPAHLVYHRFLVIDNKLVGVIEYGIVTMNEGYCLILSQVHIPHFAFCELNNELQQFGIPIIGLVSDADLGNLLLHNVTNIKIKDINEI